MLTLEVWGPRDGGAPGESAPRDTDRDVTDTSSRVQIMTLSKEIGNISISWEGFNKNVCKILVVIETVQGPKW